MSSAVDVRPRVIRPVCWRLLALAVGSLLALLFPGLDFGHPKYLGPPDELSIAYLEQVLRTHPEDRPARLLLARQQRALGHWEAAEDIAAPAGRRRRSRSRAQAEIELFELSRDAPRRAAAGDSERPLRQQQSLAALRLVAPRASGADQLAHLAETALALEAPGDAAEMLRAPRGARQRQPARLAAARGPLAPGDRRAHGQRQSLPGGEPGRAGRVGGARGRPARARGADRRPIAAAESLRAADAALGRWPTDRRLLDRGITLARAQSDGARAKRWSERLVAARPRRRRAPAAPPGHRARRRATSRRRSRWRRGWWRATRGRGAAAPAGRDRDLVGPRRGGAGRLGVAGQPRLRARASSARWRSATICSTTIGWPRCWSGARPTATITLDELLDLSDALESSGAPENARTRCCAGWSRCSAPTRAYWTERAEVAEHRQDLAGALAAVGQMQMRFGPRGEDAAHEVELLWSLGRADDALAAARRAAPMMTDDAISFWRLYGDLAWNLEADDDAASSYLRLWTLDQRDATVADRLVTLLGGKAARRRGDPHRRRRVHPRSPRRRCWSPRSTPPPTPSAGRTCATWSAWCTPAARRISSPNQAGYWSAEGRLLTPRREVARGRPTPSPRWWRCRPRTWARARICSGRASTPGWSRSRATTATRRRQARQRRRRAAGGRASSGTIAGAVREILAKRGWGADVERADRRRARAGRGRARLDAGQGGAGALRRRRRGRRGRRAPARAGRASA